MKILENVLWTEKYRPQTLEDCILPTEIKDTFREFIKAGYLPNMLLTGSSGKGKTTLAKAVISDLKSSVKIINSSLNGGIDMLRVDITNYASSMSLTGTGRKYVLLDEADYLSRATQPALRNFMEEFSANCGFIFTCNYPNRILKEIKSRLSVIDFNYKNLSEEEDKKLKLMQINRLFYILDKEEVPYDRKVVVEVFKRFSPDIRKTINELQRYSKNGKIDIGILSSIKNTDLSQLSKYMKEKDFTNVRQWVSDNSDIDFPIYISELYDDLSEIINKSKLPHLVLILNKYDFQNSFVSNTEINMTSMLIEIMSDCF